jgi:ABC-2 type transport system ATP-binding protein
VIAPAVDIRALCVDRGGRRVLHDLTLEMPPGRVVGLVGPSGCGKTTLMRAVVGVQRIAAGEVLVLGAPAGSPPLRRRVGYVTQSSSVYGELSVRENLRYIARLLRRPPGAIEDVLRVVGLADMGGRVVGSLSGGERARVSLAGALLGQPALLVADEPTVGLDPVLRRDLWETFHALARSGVSLLVSSHVMDEADRCDDLILMRDGHVLATGTPDQLKERAGATDVEGAFLALVEDGR